jgi:hypothetical protein
MARKGFWQGGKEILEELDRVAGSLTNIGPVLAAERVVRELQQTGPSWTGKFSNSWQIVGPQGQTVKGDGLPGEPRPIEFGSAPFTGRQALSVLGRRVFTTDKIVFKISNFSSYAAEATDEVKGVFIRPTPLPQTALGRSKFYEVNQGRVNPSERWDVGGGKPDSSSSRTADQDWLANYAGGGHLPKAVQIAMDAAFRGAR